jgi:hypothetical protein
MENDAHKTDEDWEMTGQGAVPRPTKETEAEMTAKGAVETPQDGTTADMTAQGAERVPEARKSRMTASGAVVDKQADVDPEDEPAERP